MSSFGSVTISLLFCLLLLHSYPSSSLPLCTDLRAPAVQKKALSFCPYNGTVCCNLAKDSQLQKQYEAMEISDPACSSFLKSILCATCDQFSADLFKSASEPRPTPLLCNSTEDNSFCTSLWNRCQNVSISNSPFAPSLQGSTRVSLNSTSSKLTELWQSKNDFCSAFGGSSSSICFDGKPVLLNRTETIVRPKGMCLEKIGNVSYLNMAPHPDGSNRAFFSTQPGKIYLATIPEQGSGTTLGIDELMPFVDLTDQVYFNTLFGMMGMAFHPEFSKNGRFFASFTCDKITSPECSGRCACNSDVGCDPSKLEASGAEKPCQYQTVVAEYTANGTALEPSKATSAKPAEVRRIFTMGLPFTGDHGGQILFGPSDGYLYLMMGDGGTRGDHYRFAQNKKSLLGKIMRFDIDNMPSMKEIKDLGLWGNYSIPHDNPHSEDKEMRPEIWALGLKNPWRCSFDSKRPPYFLCADVGQDQYEEVNIITKGGNYGWNYYEGIISFDTQKSKGKNTSVSSKDFISPILGYKHSDINNKPKSAAISGGYIYRSMTDPCMYGSYLYGDLYASAIWAASESPESSGNFTSTNIPFSCADDSPVQCTLAPESNLTSLGYIFSFGEDNKKDVYILTSTGVYRIVAPSRCNYSCSKEYATTAASPGSSNMNRVKRQPALLRFLSSLLLSIGFML